ncbi:hypothetical protein [Streptomyces sp. NPDC001635]
MCDLRLRLVGGAFHLHEIVKGVCHAWTLRPGYDNARFAGSAVDFRGTLFTRGVVGFGSARFAAGSVTLFVNAWFDSAHVLFSGAQFDGGRIHFAGASGGIPDGLPSSGTPLTERADSASRLVVALTRIGPRCYRSS